MKISIVVAADLNNGIGKNNQLLCHLPADLKYFKNITSGHCVVMGRKTMESIGRPLPNRTNIVITRNPNLQIQGCVIVSSLQAAIDYAKNNMETNLMIIGGGTIFAEAMDMAHTIYLTRIQHAFDADIFIPSINTNKFKLKNSTDNLPDENNPYAYTFEVWEKISD
ncbi:MAG: dihydrofolate reductase [Bacteroidia bacterium]|nr:dihydrofolate reductase [Bacteroidia bacterium]